jgi:hypothetical protein
MTITIELPGDELVEMVLRYHALKNSADSDGLEVRRMRNLIFHAGCANHLI